jgi:hypothetical protein
MQQRDGREELALLCAALQEGTSADWPAVVAFAGLPGMWPSASLAGTLDQRGLTYLGRGHWLDVGPLGPEDTLVALAEPVRQAGRPFGPTAADYLAEQADGYPYAVQVYGEHAWWASEGAATIGRLGGRAGPCRGPQGPRSRPLPGRLARSTPAAAGDAARRSVSRCLGQ